MFPIPLAKQQLVSADLGRLQADMELARRVQFSLLPHTPPSIPGLDVWGVCQPAAHVGGDFYDFIAHPDQSLTFFVGDVSGMSVPAALLMTMARAILRTEVDSQFSPDPESILESVNRKLLADFVEAGMFVTAFVGWYEPSNRVLVYANAGHSPVIFCPADRSARLLEADGTALGVLPESLSRNHYLCLEEGDVLIAATDGLNEARNSRCECFGIDRLMNLVWRLADRSAAEISGSLLAMIQDFSAPEPQVDDQTIVVLRCIGQ